MIASRQLPGGSAGGSEGARGAAPAPSRPLANKLLPISWCFLYFSALPLLFFFFLSLLFFYFFLIKNKKKILHASFLSLPVPWIDEVVLTVVGRLSGLHAWSSGAGRRAVLASLEELGKRRAVAGEFSLTPH